MTSYESLLAPRVRGVVLPAALVVAPRVVCPCPVPGMVRSSSQSIKGALTGRGAASARHGQAFFGECCAPGRRLPLGPPGHGGVSVRRLVDGVPCRGFSNGRNPLWDYLTMRKQMIVGTRNGWPWYARTAAR